MKKEEKDVIWIAPSLTITGTAIYDKTTGKVIAYCMDEEPLEKVNS